MTVPVPAPKKRGSMLAWLVAGCAGCVVIGAGSLAGILFVVHAAMSSSEPYKQAVARAEASQSAKDALGTPIEPGWFASGDVSLNGGGTGNADLSIPVHGSKAKGTLVVKATRKGGHWEYEAMRVEVDGGATVDLLTDSEEENL